MNPAQVTYRINTPRMIHETLDQDTVIIDAESGAYFVVGGSGPLIWQALEHGADASTLARQLAAHYGVEALSIAPVVEAFLAQLHDEQLVVPAPSLAAGSAIGEMAPTQAAPFVPPTLSKFTDMKDLLLIDPIHEVEDTGWPNRRKTTGS